MPFGAWRFKSSLAHQENNPGIAGVIFDLQGIEQAGKRVLVLDDTRLEATVLECLEDPASGRVEVASGHHEFDDHPFRPKFADVESYDVSREKALIDLVSDVLRDFWSEYVGNVECDVKRWVHDILSYLILRLPACISYYTHNIHTFNY